MGALVAEAGVQRIQVELRKRINVALNICDQRTQATASADIDVLDTDRAKSCQTGCIFLLPLCTVMDIRSGAAAQKAWASSWSSTG